MSNQDTLKRSYQDMKVGIPVNGVSVNNVYGNLGNSVNSPVNNNVSVNGNVNNNMVNGSMTTRNQQQQQQRAQVNAQQQHLQNQQKIAMMNGNTHGFVMNNGNRRNYKFTETSDEILKKYENFPPSLEFHIHENHYRFGNQDGIVSKNNQLVKDFLEYVAREEIPHAIVEVLRDAGIKLYEGCIILNLYDHRNSIEVSVMNETTKLTESKRIPRSFKTLLRPTPLSLFYDLLYQTDSALQRFSDHLGLSMESEILSITKRNLDLKVPMNPYKFKKGFEPQSKFPIVKDGQVLHDHRLESSDPESKAFKPFKELHEDSPQQSSEYEQFMLLMNDKSNIIGGGDTNSETTQFSRLRFIEQFRINKEKMKQVSMNATLSQRQFSATIGNVGAGSTSIGGTPQLQQQQLQQQRLQQMQQHQQQSSSSLSSGLSHNPGATGLTPLQQQQQNLQQQKAFAQQQLQNSSMINNKDGNGLIDEDGKKVKKPKKLTKKQQLQLQQQNQIAGKTLPGLGAGSGNEVPKKKRGSYKKKKKEES